jgi:hypothetical protein
VSGRSIMGVFRKVMNLSRSIVRALWHGLPPGMSDIKRSPIVRSCQEPQQGPWIQRFIPRDELLCSWVHGWA